jgi:hypothetical protein
VIVRVETEETATVETAGQGEMVGDVVFELLELDVVDLEVVVRDVVVVVLDGAKQEQRLKVLTPKKSIEMQRPGSRKMAKRRRYDRKQRHYLHSLTKPSSNCRHCNLRLHYLLARKQISRKKNMQSQNIDDERERNERKTSGDGSTFY